MTPNTKENNVPQQTKLRKPPEEPMSNSAEFITPAPATAFASSSPTTGSGDTKNGFPTSSPSANNPSPMINAPDSLPPSATGTTTVPPNPTDPSSASLASPPAPAPAQLPVISNETASLPGAGTATATATAAGTGTGTGTGTDQRTAAAAAAAHPSIPPPPKAGQQQLPAAAPPNSSSPYVPAISTSSSSSPYQPAHPPQEPQQPLTHPPGYIQNPAINSLNSTTNPYQTYSYSYNNSYTAASPYISHGQPQQPQQQQQQQQPPSTTAGAAQSANMSSGRWRWDDAPGGAGGRYVYQEGQPAGLDREGDDAWPGAGIWQGAVELARAAGNRLAEAEEGVWRWVNRR
ncbi:hypothetical protein AJ78_04450 [Emergomyces pasteurianus Ep9510]|uniref:Uncharacterized protein n=1 Tax=Emergomyces pasteurianus Ep9510 TaxID=1447872 RepID=A0A1J9PFP3_9EURO|nr:hypothetical protein AJ78_04450 [Emergomyces pasteurianus Ep9510]